MRRHDKRKKNNPHLKLNQLGYVDYGNTAIFTSPDQED